MFIKNFPYSCNVNVCDYRMLVGTLYKKGAVYTVKKKKVVTGDELIKVSIYIGNGVVLKGKRDRTGVVHADGKTYREGSSGKWYEIGQPEAKAPVEPKKAISVRLGDLVRIGPYTYQYQLKDGKMKLVLVEVAKPFLSLSPSGENRHRTNFYGKKHSRHSGK